MEIISSNKTTITIKAQTVGIWTLNINSVKIGFKSQTKFTAFGIQQLAESTEQQLL